MARKKTKRPASTLGPRRRKSTLIDVDAPAPKAKVPKPPKNRGGTLGTSVSRMKAERKRKASEKKKPYEPAAMRMYKKSQKRKRGK